MVASADLVVVMDSWQARQMTVLFPMNRPLIVVAGDLDPQFDESRAIVDPWNRSIDVLESSFNRLDRCAATLVRILHDRK
jgi:protein-tyrosine-phosphatase